MGLDLQDPDGDDPGQVVPDPVDGLDLQPGEGQPLGQGGRGHVDVDVLGQPGKWNPHRFAPLNW
jgi:hypothetical protein